MGNSFKNTFRINSTFMILVLSIFLFNLNSYGKARSICKQYYVEKESISLNIFQRYLNFSENRRNETPILVLSHFLDHESQDIFSRYNDQIALLYRKGIDSKLKSRLTVFDSTISTANTLGNNLMALYQSKLTDLDQQNSRSFFSFFRKDPKKLDDQLKKALEEFKKCKNAFDRCSMELNEAINETSSNLVLLEDFKKDIAHFIGELKTLEDHFSAQSNQMDAQYTQTLLAQKIDSTEMMMELMIKNSEVEKILLLQGLLTVKIEVSQFREKIDLLISKGAPEELLHNEIELAQAAAKAKADAEAQARILAISLAEKTKAEANEIAKLKNELNNKATKYNNPFLTRTLQINTLGELFEYIESISKLHFNQGKKIFSIEESHIIVDKILFLLSSNPESNFKKKILVGQSSFSQKLEYDVWVFTDLRPFLALFITRITYPANARNLNAEFVNKIYDLNLKNFDLYYKVLSQFQRMDYYGSGSFEDLAKHEAKVLQDKFEKKLEDALAPFLN